ncbi:lysoplasmalogenase [Thalassococcus sp. CAU 1522]|uniref:Lysoplasmalogenase n=1 Tax=Thalassococcus arenae TaxID=2851652 RepID=A0ABS6N2P1_9RHOB|nr:lysoplasmalogenase family protein [Thalassococcus arenae]MBV2358294.1 lysoplasmalogenase [Thalassococcus arenae]
MTWFAAILALGLAMTYQLRFVMAAVSDARSVTKTASVLALAATAVLAQAPLLVVLALLFSAAGDWALSRSSRLAFLLGISAFAFAQICYIAQFKPDIVEVLIAVEINREQPFLGLVVLGGAMTAALKGHPVPLRMAAGLYTVLLLAMALAAWQTGDWALRIGALLFVLSDAMIAVELMDDRLFANVLPRAIWVTYFAAQSLLLYGVLV